MRAFIDTLVTKNELLASLARYARADRIVQGIYWGQIRRRGCFVGCSIHDFAPGRENCHQEFERLFGLPLQFAALGEIIFENMPAADARSWPIRLIAAVPIGAEIPHSTTRRRCTGTAVNQVADALVAQLVRLPGLPALPPGSPVIYEQPADAWSVERESAAAEPVAVGAD